VLNRFRAASSASRKEALFVAAFWIVSCVYTVGYSALYAYRPGAGAERIFGLPLWVVYGVLVPWFVSLAVTLWFAGFGMKDESLGENPDEESDVE
jgi:hypothetical protein